MTVCRIDDADRLHATYQQKMSAGTGVTIILSVLILFVGLVIYGFVALSDSGIRAGFILFLIPALIVLLLVLRVIRKAKNAGYFMAYVIDDEVYQIDIAKACTNDTLFGEQYSILVGGSLAGFNRIMKNMKKLPTTSYVEEFVCNRRVAEYSGSVIDKVFSISEGKEFLTVKAQLTAVNKSSTFVPTRKKTLYIPQTFTNIDQLRSRLEYLM